jgi:hypothetical protein
MRMRDEREDFPEKSSREPAHTKRHVRMPNTEAQSEASEDWQVLSTTEFENLPLPVPVDSTSFAYQLLLLQERLFAYEQLHLEEIAELRQEIEQLRRAFLQETSPQLRAILPMRNRE